MLFNNILRFTLAVFGKLITRRTTSMRTLGNILWFVLGGVIMGLGWWLAGAIAFISIIGIPWARSCFVIGRFSFFPFGQEAIDRERSEERRVGKECRSRCLRAMCE